jgi:hypothetical protein
MALIAPANRLHILRAPLNYLTQLLRRFAVHETPHNLVAQKLGSWNKPIQYVELRPERAAFTSSWRVCLERSRESMAQSALAEPTHIVSPLAVEIVIQKRGRKRTNLKGAHPFKAVAERKFGLGGWPLRGGSPAPRLRASLPSPSISGVCCYSLVAGVYYVDNTIGFVFLPCISCVTIGLSQLRAVSLGSSLGSFFRMWFVFNNLGFVFGKKYRIARAAVTLPETAFGRCGELFLQVETTLEHP